MSQSAVQSTTDGPVLRYFQPHLLVNILVIKNNQQCGPFTEEQLLEMVNTGMLQRSDLAWHDGLPEWQPVHVVLSIEDPPPMPPIALQLQPAATTIPTAAIPTATPDRIDPNLASLELRFRAYLVDSGFFMGLIVLPVLAGSLVSDEVAFIFGFVGTLVVIVSQCRLLTRYGQTVGKLYLKIRIVDDRNDSNPGFFRAVLLRYLLPGIIASTGLGSIVYVIDSLFIFRRDRKCLHDLIVRDRAA